jgi:acetyl esterase
MTIDQNLQHYYAKLASDFPPLAEDSPVARRQRFSEIAARYARPHPPGVTTSELTLPLNGRELQARLYRPADAAARAPLLVYLHGGGWVVGDLDTHDNAAAQLAADTGAVVCSVAYRLAPEFPFPAASNDAVDAIMWLAEHRARLGFATGTLAVAGDSAGAHLVAGAARVVNTQVPGLVKAQLLIYPVVSPSMSTESYARLVSEPALTPTDMAYFWGQFLGDQTIAADNTCVDLLATAPARQPADAVVIVAGHDPLHDEGVTYARFLKQHGAQVELIEAPDMTHGFVRLQAESPAARAWMLRATQAFKALWDKA